MEELDMSGVDPLRYDEVRRRVAVVKEYMALPLPTDQDQKAHGARLGLSANQFKALVRVWRDYGSAAKMSGSGAHRRGTRAPNRLAVDPRAKEVAAQVITELGSTATVAKVSSLVGTRCEALGLTPPSDSTIWNMVRAKRQTGDSGVDGIVIGTCMIQLPMAMPGGLAQPMLTVAVRAEDKAIIAASLQSADWQSAAVTIAASTQPGTRVRVDKDLLSLKRAASIAKCVEPVPAAKARSAMSRILGFGIDDLPLIFRPSKAVSPERLLTTKVDRPLSPQDVRTIVMAAVARHNAARDARDASWIDDPGLAGQAN